MANLVHDLQLVESVDENLWIRRTHCGTRTPQIESMVGFRTNPLLRYQEGTQSSQEEVLSQLVTLKSLYQASKHHLPLLFYQ